ncbi:MAG: DJ-1/PfpI family protein [Methylovirgula sp.]|uniref:GlxA family transcriptional regulator n=1 Tax=Methylovirgula sp. TaxID=1978224 RepID=UPI003075F5EE
MAPKTVLIIAPPRVTLQDVTGPWEVFCRAEGLRPGTYDVAVVSAGLQKQVETKFGLGIVCERSVHDFIGALDTVLVAGSDEGVSGEADPAFLDWLRDAATRTRRMGSICTGSFYLAHAGLLAGRHATSHWRYLDRLADSFPDVSVERDPIFVRDGDIYTSAGITAGIDLALALVEADCGHDVSQAVARDLVVFLQRQGDQPQLSTALALRMADRDPIRSLQQWMPDNLQSVVRVEDMAAYVHMSPRNFTRLFKQQTGMTPGEYLRQLRIEAARRRVQELSGNQEAVAASVGFGSSRTLQRSLKPDARAAPRNN